MKNHIISQGMPAQESNIEQQLLNITPNPRFQFETHLVEHCNLNCQMCTHFSPLAHPTFTNHETFAADMRQMGKLFHNNEVSRILLLGGEPLLHPAVSDFLETAREKFSQHRNYSLYKWFETTADATIFLGKLLKKPYLYNNDAISYFGRL